MDKVGMIGLGAMGKNIAFNILKAGYEMVVFDVFPAAAEPVKAKGAIVADSINELGQQCKEVLVMVNTAAQAKSVFSELLPAMKEGIVICLSTMATEDAEELNKSAGEAGITYLDCPVSGGTRGAEAGTLTLMVSGPKDAYDKVYPLLNTFGNNIVYVSPEAGKSQSLKAINQLLVGVHMCATAEAFTLAKQCGLDLQLVYDVISKSAGNSNIFSNRGQFLINRDFNTRSTIGIQVKDTGIVCDNARKAGAPVYLAEKALELFKEAKEKYPDTDDSIEVVRVYEDHCN